MSKFKKKLGRRIMAVALSLAMIMSNMTVYANELSETSAVEAEESVVSTDEETVDKEAENEAAADVETETTDKASVSEKSSESDDNDEEQEDVKETEVGEKENDLTTETNSFLREDKEDEEEKVSDVDNKAALEDGKEHSFINKHNPATELSTLADFTFVGFGEKITNDHGPQSGQTDATITFTVPGNEKDKVDIEVGMCTYGGGTVTATVAGVEQTITSETVENSKDGQGKTALKYTVQGVTGGSTVTLKVAESGKYIHSIKATITEDLPAVADGASIDFSSESKNHTSGDAVENRDGFVFTDFVWHASEHGIYQRGTIELNIEQGKRAVITVTGCEYGKTGTVETNSGTVFKTSVMNSTGDSNPAPQHQIIGAEGKVKLTFSGTHYLHNISVKYMADNEHAVVVSAGENGTASASVGYAAEGAEVTLTAEPNNGYGVKEWQVIKPAGDGALTITPNVDNANSATFTMPASDVEVKAIFEAIGASHTITVTETVEHGTVTAGTVTSAKAGVTVNMDDVATVTPNDGYMLKEWNVTYAGEDGSTQKVELTKTAGKYSFTMPDADITVTAVIELKPVTYFTTTYFNQKVQSANHSQNDPVDDVDGLDVVEGTFKYWDKDHGLTVSNAKIKLTFEPGKKYDLTIWGCMYGTAISMPEDGDPKAIPETANNTEDPNKKEENVKKYTILNVENEVTLTINSTGSFVHGIVATESSGLEKYKVTVTDDGNGTAKVDKALAEEGTEITLTATPDNRYQFKEWKVISGDVKIENNKFTMPASDVEIKAIFDPIIRRDWDFANDENLKDRNGSRSWH